MPSVSENAVYTKIGFNASFQTLGLVGSNIILECAHHEFHLPTPLVAIAGIARKVW